MAKRERILMAMSGGVDSSVAAALLLEAGYEVVGATMKTFCYSETQGPSKTCCGLDGISDARRVADRLGFPHYVFDVEEAFARDVIDDFVDEYANGRTPNPCVRCNSNTKFRDLMLRGRELGCSGVASGHYVRIEHGGKGGSRLLRGVDTNKDQSYFLWALPREMLSLLHFPLGRLTKPEVRELARSMNLVTADKPESQEICFVPTGDYRDLLSKRLSPVHPALQPGPIVTPDGRTLGEHSGYAGFTIGQRKRLGGGFPEPLFVLGIRPETREVVVGRREELYADGATIRELNWLAEPPATGDRVTVQNRYRALPVVAEVMETGGEVTLRFEEPQASITPGQSAVVFGGERVLGGGRIREALKETAF